MNKTLFLWLMCISVAAFPMSCPAEDKASAGLSLAEALHHLLANNPSIKTSRQNLESARGDLLKAQGSFDWTLGGQFYRNREIEDIVGYNNYKTETSVAGLSLSRKTRFGPTLTEQAQVVAVDYRSRPIDTTNYGTLAFQITIPLLKGSGAVSAAAGENASLAAVRASEYSLAHSVADNARDMIKKYWQYLAATRQFEEARNAEQRVSTLLQETKLLVDAEQLPRSSLAGVQASLAGKTAQRQARQYAVKEAWQILALTFGPSADSLAEEPPPMTGFPDIDDTRPVLSGAAVSSLIQSAMDRRQDLLAQKEIVESNTILVKAAKHDLLPQVDMSFTVGYQGLERGDGLHAYYEGFNHDKSDPTWKAMISFSSPLENRSAKGNFMSKRAALESARITTTTLTAQIRTQVGLAVANLQSLSAQLKASRESVAQYLQAVEDEREKLRLGFSTIFEVIDYQDRLATAQTQLISVTSQLAQAIIDLRFYAGALVEKQQEQFLIDIASATSVPTVP